MKHLLLFFYLFFALHLSGQSIRKNYLEMTENEKLNLVIAFYELRNGPDLINDLATFHAVNFSFDNTDEPERDDIHFNLPDEAERDIFFAWHRMQMFEVERTMQKINPNISLPYWDSSIDQAFDSPLWDEGFMGQFNLDWSLNRNLGANGTLTTPAEVIETQNIIDFLEYSLAIENGNIHVGPHIWVGGFMPRRTSPRDPIFYLHHVNVDRIWSEWEDMPNHQSSFIKQSMIRYDGTYQFNGNTLALVNPNDIVNSRSLGVFYAYNGEVDLDNYIVNNRNSEIENFYYQFKINIGENFSVPVDGNAIVQSVNEVNILPGFEAFVGSNFEVKLDNTVLKSNNLKKMDFVNRRRMPFDDLGYYDDNAYLPEDRLTENKSLIVYPNPFIDKISIKGDWEDHEFHVNIFNTSGVNVYSKVHQNVEIIKGINLQYLTSGLYILNILDSNGKVIVSTKIIKL